MQTATLGNKPGPIAILTRRHTPIAATDVLSAAIMAEGMPVEWAYDHAQKSGAVSS